MTDPELKTQIACYISANPGCTVRSVREAIIPNVWQAQIKVNQEIKQMIRDNIVANFGSTKNGCRHKLYLVSKVLNFPVTECPF